jgi:thiamine biosynthesis lipoprotein
MEAELAGEGTALAAWPALGMLVQLAVTEPAVLAEAQVMLADDLAALDLACSRFRPDSEVAAIAGAARSTRGPVTVTVSPLLAQAVAVALRAARLTGGDVDPTVGGALADLGYDRDFARLDRRAGDAGISCAVTQVGVRVIPGWRSIGLDLASRRLTVPAGTWLDLGATVKGWAADQSAARIARELGCGVLVSLGGDTAVSGPAPRRGWRIRVQDRTTEPDIPPDGPSQVIAIRQGGVATSSTAVRRWRHGGDVVHHILDPRTARPAGQAWRTVSVAAGTCADANTAATAAVIRGPQAPGWLAGLGLPARLVARDGTVTIISAWPEAAEAA